MIEALAIDNFDKNGSDRMALVAARFRIGSVTNVAGL
jgi:hypothetical protein